VVVRHESKTKLALRTRHNTMTRGLCLSKFSPKDPFHIHDISL